jgi:hypothetical protein
MSCSEVNHEKPPTLIKPISIITKIITIDIMLKIKRIPIFVALLLGESDGDG